jgi:general stress protein 26
MTTSSDKIDELYKLIDGIEIAMLTTRRRDGMLVSRPMANQKRLADADLVFVTDVESHKLDDLLNDPHVNVSYYRDRTREWVSVSGAARLSRDRKRIRELYQPSWRAWFEDEGGERNGGPDDPRIGLILVSADSAEYLVVNKSRPVVLFEVMKGMVTGTMPDVGEQRTVTGGELLDGR